MRALDPRSVPGSRPITKALFASGLQCAKKLFLDYHEPDAAPAESLRRQHLFEVGAQLLELARTAFPGSQTADSGDFAKALKQTSGWLGEGQRAPVFEAAFAVDDLEARADIAIPNGEGAIDLYEVKAGNKVKVRHIRDLAFQVHVIEKAGYRVERVWILHLNPNYKHRGGATYPVHQLFKHVDVSTKVRRQLDKTEEQVDALRNVLQDPVTQELPTGTWCEIPFPCGYLPRCRAEGPEHPLIDLPELSRDQETELHQHGIEDLTQVDAEEPGLSAVQRRAARALGSEDPIIESFVPKELRDVDYPLHFVIATSLLQVMPLYEDQKPWQHVPFLWCDAVVDKDGSVEYESFVADGKDDPRPEFARTLGAATEDAGTLMVFGANLEQRLRRLLDDANEHKSAVRALLNQPRFDLRQLVRAGVYHRDFRGSFGLVDVYTALVGGNHFDGLEIQSDEQAQAAYQKMMTPRTRATTRTKLQRQLEEFAKACADAVIAIYRALASHEAVSR